MIDDPLITTEHQRQTIIWYIAELINNKNNITIATVLGECMHDIEFRLKDMPDIRAYRFDNPDATFEQYYQFLIDEAKRKHGRQ